MSNQPTEINNINHVIDEDSDMYHKYDKPYWPNKNTLNSICSSRSDKNLISHFITSLWKAFMKKGNFAAAIKDYVSRNNLQSGKTLFEAWRDSIIYNLKCRETVNFDHSSPEFEFVDKLSYHSFMICYETLLRFDLSDGKIRKQLPEYINYVAGSLKEWEEVNNEEHVLPTFTDEKFKGIIENLQRFPIRQRFKWAKLTVEDNEGRNKRNIVKSDSPLILPSVTLDQNKLNEENKDVEYHLDIKYPYNLKNKSTLLNFDRELPMSETKFNIEREPREINNDYNKSAEPILIQSRDNQPALTGNLDQGNSFAIIIASFVLIIAAFGSVIGYRYWSKYKKSKKSRKFNKNQDIENNDLIK